MPRDQRSGRRALPALRNMQANTSWDPDRRQVREEEEKFAAAGEEKRVAEEGFGTVESAIYTWTEGQLLTRARIKN